MHISFKTANSAFEELQHPQNSGLWDQSGGSLSCVYWLRQCRRWKTRRQISQLLGREEADTGAAQS